MIPRLRKTPGRTYYESSIEEFVLCKYPSDIVDFLTESDETSDEYELHLQKNAWANQIKILQNYLKDKKGYIIFEYVLSRVNMRIDVVLLMDDVLLELDPDKRAKLTAMLPEYDQLFCTFLPGEPYERYMHDVTKVYDIRGGEWTLRK